MKGGAQTEGEIISIGGEHIYGSGQLKLDKPKYISLDFYNKLRQGKIRLNDVLLVKDGATTGKLAYILSMPKDKMAVNEHVFIIRASRLDLLDNQFLYYGLQSFNGQEQISFWYHGLIGGVTRGNIESIVLPIPPLSEQRAISRVLRAVQAVREARLHEAKLEQERKAALMEHLFRRGTRGEATKQTEIGEMPVSWATETLGNVARISSGGTPDRNEPKYWNGNIPWIKTGEIDYKVIPEAEERITQVGLQNSAAKMIPAGTLLMAMYGQGITRGKVAILGIDAAINQACAAVLTNSNVNTNFLFYFLAHSYEKIRNLGHGANQKNLNAALIKSIIVPMPKLSEQQKIADILQACDTKIIALDHEARLLDELFRAILEELMSGRLSATGLINENDVIDKL